MKKKLALGTTALAVLASVVPTHVAPVEAEELADIVYVDSSKSGGTGIKGNGYSDIKVALEKVKPGGTIIIENKAFINDTNSDDKPFIIDKEVTIKCEDDAPAVMDIRAGGIVLGANVKFENVSLQLVNINRHDIFANGYKIELVNVATLGPANQVFDIYAGSLVADGVNVPPAGSQGQVFIKTDGNLKGASNLAKFETIYAGSMGAESTVSPYIEVENAGLADKISIENIVGTGSLKSDKDIYHATNKRTSVTLKNYFPKVNGDTGSSSSFILNTATSTPRNLNVSNIDYLGVTEGQTNITNTKLTSLPEVTVNQKAVLDLTGAAKDFTIEKYSGSGTLSFATDGHVTLNTIQGNSLTVKPSSLLDKKYLGQEYLTAPINTEVKFIDDSGLGLYLESEENDSGTLDWYLAQDLILPTIKEFVLDEEYKKVNLTTEQSIAEIPYSLDIDDSTGEYSLFVMEDYLDLTVLVNGEEADYFEDEEGVTCFYVEEHDMYIYLQPADDYDLTKQKITVEFKKDGRPVQPKTSTYNINLTLDDLVLDTALVVEDIGKTGATTLPTISEVQVENSSVTAKANEEFVAQYTFDVVADTNIDLGDYTLGFTFDGFKAKHMEATDSYVVEEKGITFRVVDLGEDNKFQLVVSGNTADLGTGDHSVVMDIEGTDITKSLTLVVKEPTPTPTPPPAEPDNKEEEKEPTQEGGSPTGDSNTGSGGSSSGDTTVTPAPPTQEGDSSTGGSNTGSGGSSSGDTTVTPAPPTQEGGSSTGGSNTGDSSSGTTPPTQGGGSNQPSTGGGGSSTPTPTPNPPAQEGGTTVTPTPPTQEVDKPTTVPSKPTVTNKVVGLDKLSEEIQQKVDSLMTDISVQQNGTIIDLVGDDNDLSSVSSLEVTNDGVFLNVGEEKVELDTGLDLSNIDWENTRVIRLGGAPVPHKATGEGFTITTDNFSNLLITSCEPEPFDDVNDGDWFKEDVEEMFNYGFTTGTTATTYSPNESITRAQFAVMLARAFELQPTNETNTLTDIGDKWYASEAQALYDAGIIKGFNDGTFGGDKELTRQQAMTMLARMLEHVGVKIEPTKDVHFKDLDKIDKEAQGAVKFLASMGVLNNGDDVDFNPYKNLTRAQMAKVVVKSVRLTDLY